MNKIAITYLMFGFQALIAYLSLKGKLVYGYGLGDLFYLILYIAATIIVTFITSFIYKNKKSIWIPNLLLFTLCIFNLLQVTILRGPALPWNGRILFNF